MAYVTCIYVHTAGDGTATEELYAFNTEEDPPLWNRLPTTTQVGVRAGHKAVMKQEYISGEYKNPILYVYGGYGVYASKERKLA
jgi:hypothetical protein